MKKIMLTTVRTLLAIAIIVAFASLWMFAADWQSWCPNGDLGFLLCVTLYILSGMGILAGLYGISPIFWIAVAGICYASIKDHDKHIEDARKAIWRLKKTWAW